jgi:hypothetical protein
MEQWDQRLADWDHGWLVILTAIIFIGFMVLVLPAQSDRAASYSAGAGSPDTTFFLPPNQLYAIAQAYGPAGRSQYIRARWTFDLAFPLSYGLFFFSAINFSLRRLFPARPAVPRLSLLALAALSADLLENAALTLLLGLFPRQLPGLASLAVGISLLKWLLVTVAMVLALGGLLALAAAAVRRRWLA